MRKITKYGMAVFALMLAISVSGCGKNDSTSTASTADSSVEASADNTTESTTDESTTDESTTDESTTDESTTDESKTDNSAAEADVKDYVYFDNSETKWQNVYAYWWNDDFHLITNKLTGEAYPANGENGTQVLDKSWPGVQMEKVGDTDIYRCVMPVEATKIIFNSGVPDEDIYAGKEGYQTGDTEFGNDYGGKIYKVDISVAAKAGRGVEKTKYKYNAGAWSDYTP